MTLIHTEFDHTTDDWQYMIACARIRDLTLPSLIKRLVTVIARDQLVLAVLDDDGEQRLNRERYEHRFRKTIVRKTIVRKTIVRRSA